MTRDTKKKIICFTLIAILLFSFTSCGKTEQQITSLEELQGKRFAIQAGNMYDRVVTTHPKFKGAKVSYCLSSADALAMVIAGKADAFVTDSTIAQSLIAEHQGLTILGESVTESEYAMAFQKDDTLRYKFDNVIRCFKENGTIDQLTEKWITNKGSNCSVVQQVWVGSNGTINCYISPDYEPICFFDEDGNLQGFEIDLVLRIAKELDYKVKFISTDFEDLLPSVTMGLADIAVGSISVTDTRKEIVDFTETYLDASGVVIVRDLSAENKDVSGSIKNSTHKFFVENDRWQSLLAGIGTTLQLVIIPIVAGLCLGVGMFLWAYSGAKIPNAICNGVIGFLGLIPAATWLMFVFYIIFSGNNTSAFVASLVAFTISFSMDVYGIINGCINAIDPGQKEAAYSMGYSKYGALFHILLPQVLPNIVASLKGPCIGEIKLTALVEFIAVGDLQTRSDVIRADTLEPFLPIIFCTIIYALIVFIASKIIDLIIKKICKKEISEEKIKERLLEGKL